jgi:hypothetical protein
MQAIVGQKLVGSVVKSGPKWVVVFPNVDGNLFYELAKEEVKQDKNWKLKRPLSWDAFETLKKFGGLHITLNKAPNDKLKQQLITFEIKGMDIWLEPEYESAINGQITKGFVVLLLKPDVPDLPFDPPCHVSIAQFIRSSK